jgi:folylpolyglutamate synthase
LQLLNGLQTNASVIQALRKSGQALNLQSLPEMLGFLARIDYKVSSRDGPLATRCIGSW